MFPHPDDSRWWLSGQVNLIWQTHGRFTSPYQGDNSLRPDPEQALSRLWTIYTGVKLPGHTELLFDIESAGGRGLSDALGLAGFTNLDVVRNPTLGSAPYIARAMVHVTVPLGQEMVDATPTPFSLAARVPARRIEIRAGKLGMADFFDVNAVGSDSHLQFTNWTVDNNGAYDYAADTRGYTYAAIVEYDTPTWSLRFGEALMPTVANGIDMDWNIAQARAENLELELHPAGGLAVRLLGYANHANMGSYDEAIARLPRRPRSEARRRRVSSTRSGEDGPRREHRIHVPQARARVRARRLERRAQRVVCVHRSEQQRAGRRRSERRVVESIAGSARRRRRIKRSVGTAPRVPGVGRPGVSAWRRGAAYGREEILETYYTAHLWRGLSASGGLQFIDHPGYNRDRGPVLVEMLRVHVDF